MSDTDDAMVQDIKKWLEEQGCTHPEIEEREWDAISYYIFSAPRLRGVCLRNEEEAVEKQEMRCEACGRTEKEINPKWAVEMPSALFVETHSGECPPNKSETICTECIWQRGLWAGVPKSEVESSGLPKYGSVKQCPKCGCGWELPQLVIAGGGAQIDVTPEWAYSEWRTADGPARIERECSRCRYRWGEQPLDAGE